MIIIIKTMSAESSTDTMGQTASICVISTSAEEMMGEYYTDHCSSIHHHCTVAMPSQSSVCEPPFWLFCPVAA